MPLDDLVSAMVSEETGFAMLADTEQTARAIVRTFLHSLRAAYWGLPEIGLPAIGNRLDFIVEAVGTLPALHSTLQHQYDRAESAYTRTDFPTAKTLFESLLLTLDTFPGETNELRVKVRTNLARIDVQLDEKQDAVPHIGEALRMSALASNAPSNIPAASIADRHLQVIALPEENADSHKRPIGNRVIQLRIVRTPSGLALAAMCRQGLPCTKLASTKSMALR